MSESTPSDSVWEAPDKRFTKTILTKGYGYYCPQDGSVCKIKVISDDEKVLTDVSDDLIKELIVGDVDDPVERILEACVRSMKNEEVCVLRFPDPSSRCQIKDKSPDTVPGYLNDLINKDSEEKPEVQGEEASAETATEENKELENEDKTDDEKMESSGTPDVPQDPTSTAEEAGDDTEKNDCDSESKSTVKDTDSSASDVVVQSNEKSNEAPDTEMDVDKDPADSEEFDSQAPNMYEVHLQLISYTREPEIWEMSITEKWRRANYHKQKGMELYTRGSYEWAFRRFSLALKYLISLEHDLPSGQEEGMNISDMKLSCYLNLGACQMRHHNYPYVVKNCSKALELQSNNSKALYRRGAAYIQIQEYEKAKEDLDKAQELEPKNQSIVKQQQILKARVHKLNQYYAKAMKKMFT